MTSIPVESSLYSSSGDRCVSQRWSGRFTPWPLLLLLQEKSARVDKRGGGRIY